MGKHSGSILFGKRSVLRWDLKKFRKGSLERKGKVIPCKGTKDRKGTGTNSGKSGTRDLEAESVGSRWSVWSM